jgi:hypothetical protein
MGVASLSKRRQADFMLTCCVLSEFKWQVQMGVCAQLPSWTYALEFPCSMQQMFLGSRATTKK